MQIQQRIEELCQQQSDIDRIQNDREAIDNWIHGQENIVADLLKGPAKFRSEAAQLELNSIDDMKQAILTKQDIVDELDSREQAMGLHPDYQQKIALDTLDEHVSIQSI